MDSKIDDGRYHRKIDESGHEIAPHEFGRAELERGILEIASHPEDQAEEWIDDVSNESGHEFGDGPAQEESDGEPDGPLLANEI